MPRRFLTASKWTDRNRVASQRHLRLALALEEELDRPTSSELIHSQDQKLQHLKNIMFGGVGVNHIRLQVDPPVSLSNLVDPSSLSALSISTHFNDNEQITLCPLEEVAEDVEIDFSKAEDFMQLETPIDARRDTDKLKLAYTVPACTFMSRLLRRYPVNRKRLAFIQRRHHSSKPTHVGNTASLAKGDGKDIAVSCQVCGRRFLKQHLFQRHILTHPDPENKIFLCQICGKRFNRADHLNRHSLLHQVSIFKCQQCGEEFDRASHLDRHRRKNHPLAGQTPIQTPPTTPRNLVPEDSYLSPSISCQPTGSNLHLLASVATPESAALQILQEGASDNLQFINLVEPEVQIGRESIVRLEQLQPESQEDKREPERPFVCEVCSHRFIRATHLRRHMRIHTGEKPFTCHICGQRYARGDYLRAHIQAHRRDKIHKCKHCGEVFHDLTRFVNHCRLLHRDMDDEYGNPRPRPIPPPSTRPFSHPGEYASLRVGRRDHRHLHERDYHVPNDAHHPRCILQFAPPPPTPSPLTLSPLTLTAPPHLPRHDSADVGQH